MIELPLNLPALEHDTADLEVLNAALAARATAAELLAEERPVDALERTVAALKSLRDFSDFDNTEFRALLVALLFDLSEIHFLLKDYKQSEKELDTLFKVLDPLIRKDPARFGQFHIMAMELSTRTLRSRKKALDLLVKQQLNTDRLYEQVNAGMTAATDKLVESLRRLAQLQASAGDYRGAMKFLAEAIKISKKRTGRVARKEIKMTIEMAEIMMRISHMRPRARRLLNAVLPHAIALETIELEEEILALTEIIDTDIDREPRWKAFMHKLNLAGRRRKKEEKQEDEEADKAAEESKGKRARK